MAGEEDYALAQQRMSSVDQEVPEEDAQLTFAGSQTAIKSWRRCGGFRVTKAVRRAPRRRSLASAKCVKFAVLVCGDCTAAHHARGVGLAREAWRLAGWPLYCCRAAARARCAAHVSFAPPQAFPHCCKSLGMSTFEAAEVDALARAGNAAAAKTWLGD